MSELLARIILAGRSDDTENWMSILVFVVLAVLWAIGGIVKAKANKAGGGDEQSPDKPVRKPPLHSRDAREQMLKQLQRPVDSSQGQHQQPRPVAQQPRMRFADLQAAVRKFAVEAEQSFQSQSGKKTPVIKPVLTEPQNPPKAVELTEPIGKTVNRQQDKLVSEPEQIESEYLSELLLDYANPEELRRAILHYEILGKPLSLRD